MNRCPMGCGREGNRRGMCKSHYTSFRRRQVTLGIWKPRTDVTGTTRRLRALTAIGYSQAQIAREMNARESWVSRLINQYGHQVNAETVARVTEVYNRLSMTPGPSDRARRHAREQGWAPPLAWDEDEIDDPAVKPHTGRDTRLPFTERYAEMRELGYNDLQIVGRWPIQPASLMRQLHRYGMTPSPALVHMVTSIKYQKSIAS